MIEEPKNNETRTLFFSAAFHGALVGWLTFGWPVSAVGAGLSTGEGATLLLLITSWVLALLSIARFLREGRRDKWTQIGFAGGLLLTMLGVPRVALWL